MSAVNNSSRDVATVIVTYIPTPTNGKIPPALLSIPFYVTLYSFLDIFQTKYGAQM